MDLLQMFLKMISLGEIGLSTVLLVAWEFNDLYFVLPSTWSPRKIKMRQPGKISILMMCHYPDLQSASD